MASVERNRALNDLLIDVSRSLLQYSMEAWPWSDSSSESAKKTLKQLAARQSDRAAELVELLAARHWTIDFGTYPTEYTDLHYVSLNYFLMLLVENENALIAEIDGALSRCRDDHQAVHFLTALLQDQREIAKRLQELQQTTPSGV